MQPTRSLNRRGPISRADLLRFMHAEADEEIRNEAAALLRLPPLLRNETRLRGGTPHGSGRANLHVHDPTVTPRRVPLRCPAMLYATVRAEPGADLPDSPGDAARAPWSSSQAEQVERMFDRPEAAPPAMPPLLGRRRLLALTLPHMRLPGSPRLDVAALVDKLSRAEFGWPLPTRRDVRAPSRVVVHADWSPEQRCFGEDYVAAARTITHALGRANCELWWITPGQAGAVMRPGWPGMRAQPLDAQSVLVVMSDFGFGSPEREAAWRHALGRWTRRAGLLIALNPCGRTVHSRLDQQRMMALALGGAARRTGPARPKAPDSELSKLLTALSTALTVEPALVRAMRQALLPGSSPALELQVWQCADMLGQLPYRRWLPARQSEWLEMLSSWQWQDLLAVREVLRSQHAHLCQAQRDEEESLLGSVVFGPGAAPLAPAGAHWQPWQSEFETAEQNVSLVARHFAEIASNNARSTRPSGFAESVAARAHERLARMPAAARSAARCGATELARTSILGRASARNQAIELPPGTPVDVASLTRKLEEPDVQHPITLALRQQGAAVWLGPVRAGQRQVLGGVQLLDFQMTPGWLAVSIDDRRRLISVTAEMLPLVLHPDPMGAGAEISARWAGGAFEVLAVSRPRGIKGWDHDGHVGVTVDRLSHAHDARFSQNDLLVDRSEGSSPRTARITGSSRLNAIGPPALIWGLDEFGAFCDFVVTDARMRQVAQRMRYIEPGTFWMGSPSGIGHDDERPRHRVTLTRGYWLADTPCTQGMWEAVMGSNPSQFKGEPDSAQRPVEQVSWDEVQGFLEKLNARLPSGVSAGLPTEAQWEYAARAGSEGSYHWGDEADSKRANWGQQQKGTTAVKRYESNGWGLYDVHGNVWEWCEGGRRTYSDRPEVDPADGAGGDGRALRGGSWFHPPGYARSAYRLGNPRDVRWYFLGFRLVLRSESPGGGAAGLGSRREPQVLGGRGGPAPAAGRGPAAAPVVGGKQSKPGTTGKRRTKRP